MDKKFSDLPEDVQQKIVDAMSIQDVGIWGTISTSERQRVRGRMKRVVALTQPPFNMDKNELCQITDFDCKCVGDAGLTTLAAACANGALAQVTELYLDGNFIGNDGLTALADACAKGALAQVTELYLFENNIGDAGLTALADACAKGALASLKDLWMDDGPLGVDHPKLKAACEKRGITLR